MMLLMAAAFAGQCPGVDVVEKATKFDTSRVWKHEALFEALDNPKAVPAEPSTYDETQHVMSLTLGENTRLYPVDGIAWHHVVNDEIEGVPVAVTF